jgi:hypothetical protein
MIRPTSEAYRKVLEAVRQHRHQYEIEVDDGYEMIRFNVDNTTYCSITLATRYWGLGEYGISQVNKAGRALGLTQGEIATTIAATDGDRLNEWAVLATRNDLFCELETGSTEMPVKTKSCHGCWANKALALFHRKAGAPDGRDYVCKSCARKRDRRSQWYRYTTQTAKERL